MSKQKSNLQVPWLNTLPRLGPRDQKATSIISKVLVHIQGLHFSWDSAFVPNGLKVWKQCPFSPTEIVLIAHAVPEPVSHKQQKFFFFYRSSNNWSKSPMKWSITGHQGSSSDPSLAQPVQTPSPPGYHHQNPEPDSPATAGAVWNVYSIWTMNDHKSWLEYIWDRLLLKTLKWGGGLCRFNPSNL